MPEVVTGLEDALQLLDEAGPEVVLLALGRAARSSISVIGAALTKDTPIGEGPTAGDLVKSMRIDVTVDTGGQGVIAKVGFPGPEQSKIAAALEYGHEIIGHRPASKVLGEAAPRPFMRPVFDGNADEAIQVFADTLTSELKKVYG